MSQYEIEITISMRLADLRMCAECAALDLSRGEWRMDYHAQHTMILVEIEALLAKRREVLP